MEQRMLVQLSGLVCGTAYLTVIHESSPAFTKPWHSAILLYLAAGVALALTGRASRAVDNAATPANQSASAYISIPCDDRIIKPSLSPNRSPLRSRRGSGDSAVAFVAAQASPAPWSRCHVTLALLALSLCLRVLVTIAWISKIECSKYSVECFLPFLLTLYEPRDTPDAKLWLAKLDDRVVRSVQSKARNWYHDSRYPCLAAMLAFAVCGGVVLTISSAPASSYICLPGEHGPQLALLHQVLGLLLDSITVICAKELLGHKSGIRQAARGASNLGWVLIASACLLSIAGVIIYSVRPDLRSWITGIQPAYIPQTAKLVLIATVTLLCTISLTAKIGLQQCVTIACFTAVFTTTWLAAWALTPAFATQSDRFLLLSFAVFTASFFFAIDCWTPAVTATYTTSTPTRSPKRTRSFLYGAGAFIVCSRFLYEAIRTTAFYSHPIDSLINEGRARQFQWQSQHEWRNESLDQAVRGYWDRYGRPPPPNFDKWYEYATERNSFTIDHFDNIHDDLLPFWSVSPARLRDITVEDIIQADNGVGGVQIRDHKASVAPGVPESHAWMLEAIINMTVPFLEHLPDMDLAFNMNDESRVMVLYRKRREQLEHAAAKYSERSSSIPRNAFNGNRTALWQAAEEGIVEPFHPPPPFKSMFDAYGSAHCPPSAPARRRSQWQLQRLCTSCLTAHCHAHGPFPASASYAANICHQPDMAHLHGAYSAPSTFRPIGDLRPTFSQSKAPGFLDIRYPNPWNYAELVKYAPDEAHPDPDFTSKTNTLFWRGTTTEGFASADGRHAWRGMTRQRFVDAVNFPLAQRVLLPSLGRGGTVAWKYDHLSARDIYAMLDTNVAIDTPIARCMHNDCSDQIVLFNRTNPYASPKSAHTAISDAPVNFQDHWQYRYLFDMDGAGLSGRFIPFLRSKSLVVKTTSIFSEWWDGRVQEWWHYVPVDPRLTGLYSTLAFFMGVKPGATQSGVQWAGQESQAEVIANNGRQWAERVLRREDMEIYMFRLLLEWGRLVDDDRDVIGFQT